MPRIRVEPEELRYARKYWDRAAQDLDDVQRLIRSARRILDQQSLASLKNPHLAIVIEQSQRQAQVLTHQSAEFSHRLERIAQRFESADHRSTLNLPIHPLPYFPDHLPSKAQPIALDYAFEGKNLDLSGFDPIDLYWTPAPNITAYENITAEDLMKDNPDFGDWFPELASHVGHLTLTIMELAAGHVPTMILLDSNGEPLGYSLLPDSFKPPLPGGMGPARTL